jgi:DNA-binding NarL/FixJ family response regulator
MAATVRQHPTRRQLEVQRVYITAGSIAAAAHDLEIAESTARQHLSGLYRRTGCLNAAQAAYLLGHADSRARRGQDARDWTERSLA